MNAQALLPAIGTACALLVVSGLAKLQDPAPARAALERIGLRSGRMSVLTAAAIELLLGGSCLVWPTRATYALTAIVYLAFAGVVRAQLRLGEAGSCGCLGAADTPPSRVHVALNLIAAAAAVAASLSPPTPLVSLAHADPLAGVIVVVAVATAAYLAAATMTLLPSALAAYEGPA